MSTNESVLSRSHHSIEVDTLSSLLRAELSACETYRTAVHAIERESGNPALSLRCLYGSHRHFADELRGLIRGLGGHPTESVGAWGAWSGVHERIAEMQGGANDTAALHALRHGERFSLELARDAVHELEGPPAAWVKGRLAEGIEENLALLTALADSIAQARERYPT